MGLPSRFLYLPAIGYDGMAQEAVRVPYTEPFFAREIFDKKHGVVRLNIT